ncbi:MAG: radical SAM protein [Desulfuromonadaceae bacterium]|nr:radical SAM protein [Desulfuromonadaceae bacterium]MDD5104189.1 radical SAM protein [Desulfuromonadaceae bacterium]
MKILFVIYQLMYADCSALGYLSAIAKQLGHETSFCSLDRDDLLATVDLTKPDVIAYSATVLGYDEMVRLNGEARKKHTFTAIMGGAHSTFSSETFPQSGMDAFCIGEGDYAFRDFLVKVANGESFDDVANLVTRNKKNPVRPLIANLDELPMPDRDLTLANSYLRDTPKKTFFATRGCPFECSYCCNNYYHRMYKGKGAFVRRFSVDRLIREIEYVGAHYRMDFVKFGDDLFAAKADDWMVEFAEQYSQRIRRPFNCYLRLDTVDDSLLKLLQKSGCYSVSVSIDSTSQHVRENVLKRRFKQVDIKDQLKKIRSYGIGVWANFMTAVPESTIENELDTIRLSKEAGLLFPAYSTTVPMKGTELYDYCVTHKYIDPENHNYDMSGCYERSTLKCFSEKEKNIRYNVFLMGGIISKLPSPLHELAIQLIKVVPPNLLFKKMHYLFDQYYLTRKIFNFTKETIDLGSEYNKNRFLFLEKDHHNGSSSI